MNRTGSGITAVLIKYLKYRIRSKHKKGRGIHSPFVFDLASKVIYNADEIKLSTSVLDMHNRLFNSGEILSITDHGAGSRITSKTKRKVSSITKSSSVNRKFGKILYRLATWYQPETILELGTGIGVSTAYLAAGRADCEVHTIEGSPEKQAFASEQLATAGLENISFYQGTFDNYFGDLLRKLKNHSIVFIDGDHRFDPTVNTVRIILEEERLNELIIILDDIHWSDEMESAWKELCQDERISVSVNLFFMGILIIRPEMKKQHFNITL